MSSVIITGDTSGAITLAAPSVAGTNTITLPAVTGNVITSGDTGTVTKSMISTSTSTGMGICRAWINFSGTTINNSYNIASISSPGTGVYQITFTTAFANANYCPMISSAFASGVTENVVGTVYNDTPYAPTTTVLTVVFHNGASGARVAPTFAYVAVFA